MHSSIIRPERFYADDSEKTKFNWFCYEFASDFVTLIDRRLQRRLHRKGLSDADIAEFAAQYAKRLKVHIEEKLAGKYDQMQLNYQDIERLLPHVGDRLVDELLTLSSRAWEELLEMCSVCPTRCITERHIYTPFFDEPPE